MISAYARGAQVLKDRSYLETAATAAQFFYDKMYDQSAHTMIRNYRYVRCYAGT